MFDCLKQRIYDYFGNPDFISVTPGDWVKHRGRAVMFLKANAAAMTCEVRNKEGALMVVDIVDLRQLRTDGHAQKANSGR